VLLRRKPQESIQLLICGSIIIFALSESRLSAFYERHHGQTPRLRHMLPLESPDDIDAVEWASDVLSQTNERFFQAFKAMSDEDRLSRTLGQ
jgi:hypothetical protein